MPNKSNVTNMPQKAAPETGKFAEIGRSGVKRTRGFLQEEFLTQLRGRNGIRVYREMRDNDNIVGASTYALEQTIRSALWWVQPGGDSPLALKATEFLKQCMGDMEFSWDATLSETLTQFTYGWALQELVYKKRDGDVRDPRRHSKFNDGKIGWRKMPLRLQSSLWEWEYDEETDQPIGMTQLPAPSYKLITVPFSKAIHFRTRIDGNNPEGRSLLRNAYRSWYIKKTIEEIEAIGVERDLIGLPVITAPEGFDFETADTAVVNGIQSLNPTI